MTASETAIFRTVDSSADSDPQIKLVRQAKQGDQGAFLEIIERNMGMIVNSAKDYERKRGFTGDDAIQEASIVVANAVSRFDEDGGTRFSTFAFRCLKNAAMKSIRDNGRQKRTPLQGEPVSLDRERSTISGDDDFCLLDTIPDLRLLPEPGTEQICLAEALEASMEGLSDERMPVVLRLVSLKGMNNRTVGEAIGVSRETVRTLRNGAFKEIRNSPAGEDLKHWL